MPAPVDAMSGHWVRDGQGQTASAGPYRRGGHIDRTDHIAAYPTERVLGKERLHAAGPGTPFGHEFRKP